MIVIIRLTYEPIFMRVGVPSACTSANWRPLFAEDYHRTKTRQARFERRGPSRRTVGRRSGAVLAGFARLIAGREIQHKSLRREFYRRCRQGAFERDPQPRRAPAGRGLLEPSDCQRNRWGAWRG